MNAKDFNTIFEELQFRDQEHAAEVLGVSLRTVNGYANGATIPEPVARLLRLMKRHKIAPETVR